MKREREESFVRFGVTTVANRSHQDRDIASTVFVILSGWSAELRRWPRFCRHRPTPGLFHLLFTGRWFLKESLRNNYYRGQSLARIQRNRLFQEHSERATTVGTRFLLSRRWKRGVELETREEERQIERERMRKGNVRGRLGENIMRKALRVLRGLYSARHYRRSFLVYEFHPSPFSSSFLPFSFPLSSFSPLGYFLYFFLFPSPARFFFFFILLPFPQLSTQGHYVTGTMPANEDCGERLLIPYSKSSTTDWYNGRVFDYHQFLASTSSFTASRPVNFRFFLSSIWSIQRIVQNTCTCSYIEFWTLMYTAVI